MVVSISSFGLVRVVDSLLLMKEELDEELEVEVVEPALEEKAALPILFVKEVEDFSLLLVLELGMNLSLNRWGRVTFRLREEEDRFFCCSMEEARQVVLFLFLRECELLLVSTRIKWLRSVFFSPLGS